MSDQMPMFDDPIPDEVPKPRKPRQKPVKAAKAASKKRRKRRTAKKTALVSITSGVAKIIDTHAQIEFLLAPLTKAERKSMLEHLRKNVDGRAD